MQRHLTGTLFLFVSFACSGTIHDGETDGEAGQMSSDQRGSVEQNSGGQSNAQAAPGGGSAGGARQIGEAGEAGQSKAGTAPDTSGNGSYTVQGDAGAAGTANNGDAGSVNQLSAGQSIQAGTISTLGGAQNGGGPSTSPAGGAQVTVESGGALITVESGGADQAVLDGSAPASPSGGQSNGIGGSTTIEPNGSGGSGAEAAQNAGSTVCAGHVGPTYEQFFDNQKLATINIHIAEADLAGYAASAWLDMLWTKWKHCPPHTDAYVLAQFQYQSPDGVGDITCEDVGIRLRGSRQRGFASTQGFKLDFQILDTPGAEGPRRFADLNRVNILSVEMDPSHMMQCVAYKAFRDFGLPAPKCNHLKVYVNDAYYGLLENVEQVNRGFLRRHFGSNTGSLYAGSPSNADCPNGFQDSVATLTYKGDSFSSYTDGYELLTGTAADAEANLVPMLKCGDATQTPDDAAFRTCISEWIDVDEWLRQIAVESIMPTLESFLGYYRNFYLYFKPDSTAPHGGRFVLWSWDLDTAYDSQRCSPSSCDVFTAVDTFYGPRNTRSPLVTRLTTVFRAEYCAVLQAFLDQVYSPSLVDNMAAVMEPGIAGEPTVTPEAWQTDVTAMRDFITTRATTAQSQVAAGCQ